MCCSQLQVLRLPVKLSYLLRPAAAAGLFSASRELGVRAHGRYCCQLRLTRWSCPSPDYCSSVSTCLRSALVHRLLDSARISTPLGSWAIPYERLNSIKQKASRSEVGGWEPSPAFAPLESFSGKGCYYSFQQCSRADLSLSQPNPHFRLLYQIDGPPACQYQCVHRWTSYIFRTLHALGRRRHLTAQQLHISFARASSDDLDFDARHWACAYVHIRQAPLVEAPGLDVLLCSGPGLFCQTSKDVGRGQRSELPAQPIPPPTTSPMRGPARNQAPRAAGALQVFGAPSALALSESAYGRNERRIGRASTCLLQSSSIIQLFDPCPAGSVPHTRRRI